MAVLDPVVRPATDLLAIGVAKVVHRRTVGAQTVGRDPVWCAMTFERLFHERKRGGLVSCPGDVALQDLTFLVDGAPEIDHLAVQLHVHLVQVPPPVAEPTHPVDALPPDVASEHRPKAVPPQPYRFMTDVDPTLEQQVLDVPQRQREAHVHQHHQPDHLRRRVEVAKRTGWLAKTRHALVPTP